MACCKDELHIEWFQHHWTHEVQGMVGSGVLKVPCHVLKGADPPDALCNAMPEKPVLNKLVWSGEDGERPFHLDIQIRF